MKTVEYFKRLCLIVFLILNFSTTAIGQVFQENFDSVTPPALPDGWTSQTGSGAGNWVTVADTVADRPADSPPNSVFLQSANSQDVRLIFPIITLSSTGTSEVSLRHRCKTESGWDGGVLEISVNGGGFVDIYSIGTSIEGPYAAANLITLPFGVARAWTGEANYVTSRISLPSFASGTTLRFRFRQVSDPAVTLTGCSFDTFILNGTDLMVTLSDSKDPVTPGSALSYTVTVHNNGPLDETGVVLKSVLPNGFNLSSSSVSQGVLDTSKFPEISAVIGAVSAGSEATVELTGTAPTGAPRAALVRVESPSDSLRDILANEAQFGTQLGSSSASSGELKLANDAVGDGEDGCSNFAPDFAAGKILLLKQTTNCSFNQQVFNAQVAGAIGAIIFNTTSEAPTGMISTGIAVNIPALSIGVSDGTFLKNLLTTGVTSVSMRAFSDSVFASANAFGGRLENSARNNFAGDFTVVVPDSDGDGVVDPLEACPQDPNKTQPGACGCGVADIDGNGNGILDCFANLELKPQVQALRNLVGQVKALSSNPTKKQKSAQKKAKNNLKNALSVFNSFIQTAGANIKLTDQSLTIGTLSSDITAAINKVIKARAQLKKNRKLATKLLDSLIAALG